MPQQYYKLALQVSSQIPISQLSLSASALRISFEWHLNAMYYLISLLKYRLVWSAAQDVMLFSWPIMLQQQQNALYPTAIKCASLNSQNLSLEFCFKKSLLDFILSLCKCFHLVNCICTIRRTMWIKGTVHYTHVPFLLFSSCHPHGTDLEISISLLTGWVLSWKM